jgi:Fe-S-cluster containining protein
LYGYWYGFGNIWFVPGTKRETFKEENSIKLITDQRVLPSRLQTDTLLQTSLPAIVQAAIEKEDENDRFRSFLKEHDSHEIDLAVYELNNNIAPKMDCTACGNCCKSLMVNINDEEADALSAHLQLSRENFDAKYIEKGSSMMILNSIPCHFLNDNKCTVYEHRFAGCKEFPALHLPDFNKRLFTTFMHYDRCPIIFNVVEQLKDAMNFEK